MTSHVSAFPALPRILPGGSRLLVLALLLPLASCASGRAAAPPSTGVGLIGEELRPVPATLLGNVDYDLPVEANSWVQSELDFLLGERRETVRSWLQRSDFYADFVQSVFREEGIPTDLYHLGMIESGYIPSARSRAGAVGMWQFMPAASRDVGLRIESMVDERMDPVRSTRAAARHLRTLYRIHGDWALAAAAYNAGSGRISRGLERFRATNFWDLAQRGDLAAETQHYVPRLYAMTIIGRDRERFGFDRRPPGTFAFDSVHVEYSVGLDDLAELGGVSPTTLRDMNPHLLHGVTPAHGYWVWVPAGAGPEIQRAYIIAGLGRGEEGTGSYTVRWGDSLGRIAQRSGVGAARIRELNPAIDFDRLQAGATIRLPAESVARLAAQTQEAPPQAAAREEMPDALVIPETRAVAVAAEPVSPEPPAAPTPAVAEAEVHRVDRGETLSAIAVRYGVSVAELRRINGIEGSIIVPGQQLRIREVAALPPAEAAPEVEHVVAAGETLSAIARRYGTTVTRIQESNGISGSVIRPGQRLRIAGAAAAGNENGGSANGAASVVHVVEPGETLWGIASRYGSTVEAIQRANELGTRPIVPGQRLTVPR